VQAASFFEQLSTLSAQLSTFNFNASVLSCERMFRALSLCPILAQPCASIARAIGSSVSSTVFSIGEGARYYAKLAAQTVKSDCSRDELSDIRKFIVADRVDRSR
jgi:hypothetical protein